MKLVLAEIRERGNLPKKAGQPDRVNMPLPRRIQYAIDVIESEAPDASQARAFLEKVLAKKLVADDPALESKLKEAISYGT